MRAARAMEVRNAISAFEVATTSCSAGGSATRNDGRLPRRQLRLRCAPPSSSSAERSEAASRLSKTTRRVSCGITSSDGGSERARRVRWKSETRSVLSKSPLPPAPQEVVPHETMVDSRVGSSGFAALRLRPRARSAAKRRAGCPRRRGAFRVASLPVMADPNARGVRARDSEMGRPIAPGMGTRRPLGGGDARDPDGSSSAFGRVGVDDRDGSSSAFGRRSGSSTCRLS
jgi:hypothetical protein